MAVTIRRRRLTAVLRSGKKVYVPALALDSGRPGPVLLLTAAQHGNEVQGCETIRRFIEIASRELVRGKVFAVPFVNLPAIRDRRPHINMGPEQAYSDDRGHNMNRTWPGKKSGNDTARISYAVYQAFGDEATHVLDFHCWNGRSAPGLLIRTAGALRDLALKIGHRFVIVCPPSDYTLAGHFCATGRIGMTYEFAGQYLLDEAQMARGLRVVMNLAKLIGLLPGPLQKGDRPVLFSDAVKQREVKAPCAGLFVAADKSLCDPVRKGELLGHVLSDTTLEKREIKAPVAGYLKRLGAARPNCDVALPPQHPYLNRAEVLATIVWPTKQG